MKMEGEQQLFLMEFLIDKVNIPAVRAIHEEMLPVTTCVSFQILGLPPVNISQETQPKDCTCVDDRQQQTFKKGKSCLFALPTTVLQKPLSSFPVIMSVYEKLPAGFLPDVMLIGTRQIQTKDPINASMAHRAFSGGNPSKTIRNTFEISTATGQCVGEVTLFLRVSCLGKKIVTSFQIPHNRKPFLFKGEDDGPVFRCKRIPSSKLRVPKCICLPKPCVANDGSGEASPGSCNPCTLCCPPPKPCTPYCPPCPPCRPTPAPVPPCSPPIPKFSFDESKLRKCGCTVKEKKTCSCA